MKYNKLVRDKIPEIIKNKGQIAITHIANDKEYYLKLQEKLKEEVEEFLESNNNEELVDILEVIYAICNEKGISQEKLEELRIIKNKERGSFKDKVILDETK